MRETLMLMAVLAGTALPLQAAINGQLRQHAGSPVLTSLISFGAGTLTLAAIYFVLQRGSVPLAALGKTSWWMWVGGPLGTLLVLAGVVLTPRLGTATMIVLVIAGQLCMALLLDHFGLLGVPLRPVGAARLGGAVLVLAGAWLITRG